MIIIKLIQETLKKTQQEIANDLGVSRQTVSMWYSGYKLSNRNIENISKRYNIPIQLIQKSQITGTSLSKDEINTIKNHLLDNISEYYNHDIIHLLFSLLSKNIIYKQENLSNWIKRIKEKTSYTIENYKEGYVISNCLYNFDLMILVHKYQRSVYEILKELDCFQNDDNVTIIICEDAFDKIELIKVGE